MSERRLHVIGSYPAATAEAAMNDMLSRAAPQLAYLPYGEPGERRDWIVHIIINGLRIIPTCASARRAIGRTTSTSSTTPPAARTGCAERRSRHDAEQTLDQGIVLCSTTSAAGGDKDLGLNR